MFASGLIWPMETVSLLTARRFNIFSTTTQFSSNDIEIISTNSQSRFAVISFCQPDLSFCTNLNIEDILTSTNPGRVVTSPWRTWPGSITETWRRHLLWRWREVSWGQVLLNNEKQISLAPHFSCFGLLKAIPSCAPWAPQTNYIVAVCHVQIFTI